MNFRGHVHESIYTKFLQSRNNAESDKATLSAAFLLSADSKMWNQAKRQIENGEINFDEIKIESISTVQYTLLRAAQDLYEDTQHLSLADISDRDIIPEWLFNIINEAIRIRRYGVKAGDINC